MPIFIILGCEVAVLSFLIGAYFHSVGLGAVLLGGSGLILYAFFQNLYSLTPFLWGISLLGGLTALLWGSYLDWWLGTNFIALFLAFLCGAIGYAFNYVFLKKYHL